MLSRRPSPARIAGPRSTHSNQRPYPQRTTQDCRRRPQPRRQNRHPLNHRIIPISPMSEEKKKPAPKKESKPEASAEKAAAKAAGDSHPAKASGLDSFLGAGFFF